MELSSQKPQAETLFCLVRRRWVAALPEERVRQHLIKHLVELGFPLSLMVLEMGLGEMPHLKTIPGQVPERRADLVCFAKGIHPVYALYPLLLVECKSVDLSAKTLNQVTGYNHYLKACFIAVANQTHARTGWFDPQKKAYVFVDHIPSYEQLVASICK